MITKRKKILHITFAECRYASRLFKQAQTVISRLGAHVIALGMNDHSSSLPRIERKKRILIVIFSLRTRSSRYHKLIKYIEWFGRAFSFCFRFRPDYIVAHSPAALTCCVFF